MEVIYVCVSVCIVCRKALLHEQFVFLWAVPLTKPVRSYTQSRTSHLICIIPVPTFARIVLRGQASSL